MIRVIDGLPEHVVGFEALGKVTAEDYDTVLIPAVDRAVAGGHKARLLVIFGTEFEGYAADAALDDMKMGLHNWNDFERIGFVSDHDAYRAFVKGMGFLIPGAVKVFGLDELDEAKEWVAGVPNL